MAQPVPQLPPVPSDERVVTMPARYRGAALSALPSAPPSAGGMPSAALGERKFPLVPVIIAGGAVVLAAIAGGAWWMLSAPAQPTANVPVVSNTNANANRPVNRNANSNANANTNANTNSNRNANQNSNTNSASLFPEPEPTTETPPTALAPAASPVVRNAPDSDADGLTDAEERDIYLSDTAKPDSDGDGYLDGAEVFSLYSPTAQQQTLLAGGRVRVMAEQRHGVETLAPAGWVRQVVDAETGAVAWVSASGDFVQMFTEENPTNLTPEAWYLARSPGVSRTLLVQITTASGLKGVKSPDGLNAYITLPNGRMLVATYNVGTRTEALYRRTFEMMLNALKSTVVVSGSATSTPR